MDIEQQSGSSQHAGDPERKAAGPEPRAESTEPEAPGSEPAAGGPGSVGASSEPVVEVDEGESAGMAQMVTALLKPAVKKNPRTAAKIRGSLALKASDHDAGVTLSFEPGRVTVTGSLLEDASVVIEAPLMTLGTVAQGGHAVRALVRREVRVRRALRHPLLLIRVRRLLKGG